MSAKQNKVRKIYAQIHMSEFKNIKDEEKKNPQSCRREKAKQLKEWQSDNRFLINRCQKKKKKERKTE